MVSAKTCCHLSWALLLVLCALTLLYGSCQDDDDYDEEDEAQTGLDMISINSPFQEFDDDFRIRIGGDQSEGMNTMSRGSIISDAVKNGKDGSFSMEIQYQYNSLISDVIRQSVNTVIQLTSGDEPQQNDWIAKADSNFAGFAIILSSLKTPGHEEYTSPLTADDVDGNIRREKYSGMDITVTLVYRDETSGDIQRLGSCTQKAFSSKGSDIYLPSVGILENSGLRLQYQNEDGAVMFMVEDGIQSKWRNCVHTKVNKNIANEKMFEKMRLSIHSESDSSIVYFDLFNARVWNTPTGGFDSPAYGFKSKRLLDADADERVILVANTFEHKLIVIQSALDFYTSHVERMVDVDLKRMKKIEEKLNGGLLAQIEERMVHLEKTLLNDTDSKFTAKLSHSRKSVFSHISTKGEQLAGSYGGSSSWIKVYWVILAMVMLLGIFAWRTLSGGEAKASYGGVLIHEGWQMYYLFHYENPFPFLNIRNGWISKYFITCKNGNPN